MPAGDAATPMQERADGGASAVHIPVDLDAGAGGDSAPAIQAEAGPCPADMALVDTNYCPHIERECLDKEYSKINHITLCHNFSKRQRCLVKEEPRRFCIDRYEYPNREGAHPPWMVSWFDAQATCASKGKRLCYESEWVAACEGPNHTPFPYGWARDNTKCNIDNTWIDPELSGVYSKDPNTALRELSRLDRSVPSGSKPECKSGFGVYDMTGNFDEWVTAERDQDDKSQWAGLKGGAWGHVRNACRPMTTSHPPDFTYYFIAFRCCADAEGGTKVNATSHPPEVEPADRAPIPTPVNPPGPSKTKAPREDTHEATPPPPPPPSDNPY